MNKQIQNSILPTLRFAEFVNSGEWEKISLDEVLNAESSTLAQNKLQLLISGYPVYGASGFIGYIDTFSQKTDYVAIIKDGSGVGKLFYYKGHSSVLGTLTYLKSKDENAYSICCLYYLLQTIDFSSYVKGSGIPHIYSSDYLKELVAFPKNIEEQQKIASCLTSIDDLITAHTQKLKAHQQHKKGLMQNLFPSEGETVPKLRFKEFEDSGVWVVNEFSTYIKLYRGSSPRPIQEYLTQNETGVNWIKIGDTKFAVNSIISKVEEKITSKGAEKSRKVEKGELILANSMSFGKSYQLDIEGCIYDGWFVLREYEEYFYKPFLLQLLNSEYMQNQYAKYSAGGIVQNISSEIVYKTLLFHTSPLEQQKIASCLSSLDDLITAQSQKIEQLKKHKKGLMQQLFPSINQ